MFTIWRSVGAFGCAMVLAVALSGTALAAGCESVPPAEGPAGPLATMPGGSVATPPVVTGMPAAAASCPAAPYGPRSYAPGSGKTVALTFDDGPGGVQRIIRLAEAEGAKLRHPVVLMHNQPIGNPATVSALPVIIRFFRSQGYKFVVL